MITYEELKTRPKDFLSVTGLALDEFAYLLSAFEQVYQEQAAQVTVEGQARQRQAGGGVKGKLARIENKLLFILLYEKTYPLQTLQGLSFELSQPQTNAWIQRLLPVLQETLKRLGLTPEREGQAFATSAVFPMRAAALVLDGTERRRQRPQDGELQSAHYSGKKKAHTDKNVLIVDEQTGEVLYLSATEVGKTHDKKLADEAQIIYPNAATVAKDTGFQGYEPPNVLTFQPKKSQKGAN